ncbi:sugar-binding domain-containing protein [Marinoscillum sp. MHG1-6]|uniref:sugar-binding domain-containing protein n=1 Tax=Marinoscillum sp. MHG1-6 TaxID=2959627 RepID=UPI002158182C|nr:sugar-binding domain-containing protein [Marinoscillum sp. MHG1-6]
MRRLHFNSAIYLTPSAITFSLSIIWLLASCQANVIAQIPERKQTLDYDWKFRLGDVSEAKDADFDDSDWRELNLPHDWSIEGKIAADNSMGNDGGYFPAGIGWYRKTFVVPNESEGDLISIYFEGVYMNSEVFINGLSLGIHPYGYTSFSYDLTPYINYGGENVIAVRVDNSEQKNSRWYSGSGIYRHVWLQVTDPVHLAQWGVTITTPEVSPDRASVAISSLIKNETKKQGKLTVETILYGDSGIQVGTGKSTIKIAANTEIEVAQSITIEDPKLWSPEAPNLYTARVHILNKKGDLIDESIETFGVRSIKISAEEGFVLNGKSIILNGGCVHHDNGCLGAAAYDRAEERKVELLKAAGYNAVRTAHNPPSEAFLDFCDRLGLLVVDESFDGWRESKTTHDYSKYFDEWWKKDVQSMVLRDRNHPSIIMWSVGNEIIERLKPEAVETMTKLKKAVYECDTTRAVTSAMTSWNQGWDVFDPLMDAHDVCGYNYMLHEAEKDHERDPDRIIFQSESYPKDAFWVWDMSQKHKYVIGDFVWTAIDYLGESGIGRYHYSWEPGGQHWEKDFYPNHGAYCGDIDLVGWRKPISHYRSLLWNDEEKLYMAVKEPNPKDGEIHVTWWGVWPTWESWTWPGREGDTMEVEVYSKYPAVRLYQDGALVGEELTGKEQEFKATFAVPYSEGMIKAVAVENGEERETVKMKTAGKATGISLKADRKVIKANAQDLAFVTVEIVDQDGNVQPNAENLLEFSINGPGIIAGVDNANLSDSDPYVAKSRKAWKGRALVVIRSTREEGDIVLTVTSQELPESRIKISSGLVE